jgi:GH25 family lysozyme M1 (1,4-beta-N-acetylmuramidase)
MTATKQLVIDIYYGDQVTDFAAVKSAGVVGVIHKASEGVAFADKLYAVRRQAFSDLGLKWGAYHFFHGNVVGSDPKAEADHFLSVADPDADTLVALDWEDVPHHGAPSAASARAFLERIEDRLGRKAVIYSGNVAKEELKGRDAYFGAHRLWLCQYGPAWKVQQSWTAPWLWQNNGDSYGPGPHQIPGIRGNCDNNCLIDPMTVDDLINGWAA